MKLSIDYLAKIAYDGIKANVCRRKTINMEFFGGKSIDELKIYQQELEMRLKEYKGMGLDLNMARGKPCKEQLDLSNGMIDGSIDYTRNMDYRNYGLLDGIPEAKTLFAKSMNVAENELIIGGNSSLNLMYDMLTRILLFGTVDSEKPWKDYGKVKFLCPAPGYDRHFGICEDLGIEMIYVPMTPKGPDMDFVEEQVKLDESIKGIWCIPKYSNPTGITYADDVVERLASMSCAAKDFRIMWDNAYTIHHLNSQKDRLKDLLETCKAYGNENRAFMFTSTSKVTFPGSGVAIMAMSEENANEVRRHMGYQTIGSNKINQWMHIQFLPTLEAIEKHMMKHGAILEPKFNMVLQIFERELSGLNIGTWNNPKGGYFINLDVMEGCAKDVVACCAEHGVTLTPAGATFPYGKDPKDSNIRIAPSFPTLDELEQAMEILVTCIQYVALKKIIA